MPKKMKSNIKNNNNHNHGEDVHHLKYKICISGSADTSMCSPDSNGKTEELGRLIAERGMILVTGATTGAPYWAAKGAKRLVA
jgi:predicted Rossmann-fold nucleotide-binding protein